MAAFYVLVFGLFYLFMHLSICQDAIEVDTRDGKAKGIKRRAPHSSWTKYIHCETCQYATDKLYNIYESFKDGPDWDESTIIDILHDICNPFSNIGLWISTIDLYVDVEHYLTFDQNDKFGMCYRECETIAKACQETISDEAEDISEWIWLNQAWIQKDTVTDYICNDFCEKGKDGKIKVPKKKRKKDKMGKEEWVEMTDEELARRREQMESVPAHLRRWGSDKKQKPEL